MEAVELFLENLNNEMKKLHNELTEASWMAQTTGDPDWAKKSGEAETRFNVFFSKKETFEKTKQYLRTEGLTELQKRELHLF